MGDPWAELNEKIDNRVNVLKADIEEMGERSKEEIVRAKEDAIFQAISRLSSKVDALAARLPELEEVVD